LAVDPDHEIGGFIATATATLRVVGAPFTGAAFNTSLMDWVEALGSFQPFSNLDIDKVFAYRCAG